MKLESFKFTMSKISFFTNEAWGVTLWKKSYFKKWHLKVYIVKKKFFYVCHFRFALSKTVFGECNLRGSNVKKFIFFTNYPWKFTLSKIISFKNDTWEDENLFVQFVVFLL